MKKAFSLFLAMLMVFSLCACGSSTSGGSEQAAPAQSASSGKGSVTDVELLGGTSTVGYVATAISEVVTKNSPSVRLSAVGTNGAEANVGQMQKKGDTTHATFMASTATYKSALHAKGAFEGQAPEEHIRLLGGFMFGVNGFVTVDPTIKSLEDLDGKTVAMVADTLPQALCMQIFKNLGINVKIETMGFNDQFDAMGDGIVDACMYFGTMAASLSDPLIPVSALQEVVANHKNQVWAISIPDDVIDKAVVDAGMADYWPYVPVMAVPGSLSEAQTDPFGVYGAVTACFCCWDDLDEDLAYEITKTLCENVGSLGDYFNSIENLTAEEMVAMLAAVVNSEDEVHPGALKYYKESGLWSSFENSPYAN